MSRNEYDRSLEPQRNEYDELLGQVDAPLRASMSEAAKTTPDRHTHLPREIVDRNLDHELHTRPGELNQTQQQMLADYKGPIFLR